MGVEPITPTLQGSVAPNGMQARTILSRVKIVVLPIVPDIMPPAYEVFISPHIDRDKVAALEHPKPVTGQGIRFLVANVAAIRSHTHPRTILIHSGLLFPFHH